MKKWTFLFLVICMVLFLPTTVMANYRDGPAINSSKSCLIIALPGVTIVVPSKIGDSVMTAATQDAMRPDVIAIETECLETKSMIARNTHNEFTFEIVEVAAILTDMRLESVTDNILHDTIIDTALVRSVEPITFTSRGQPLKFPLSPLAAGEYIITAENVKLSGHLRV